MLPSKNLCHMGNSVELKKNARLASFPLCLLCLALINLLPQCIIIIHQNTSSGLFTGQFHLQLHLLCLIIWMECTILDKEQWFGFVCLFALLHGNKEQEEVECIRRQKSDSKQKFKANLELLT